jgi:hypothetical protein
MIAGLRRHHKLSDLLQVAGLARSTFYYQCRAIMGTEQQCDIGAKIRAVYDEHKGRYGYRRITATLRSSMAVPINHKCVQRLMQKMGLLRISAIVDACFRLIVDGESVLPWRRWGSAQELV